MADTSTDSGVGAKSEDLKLNEKDDLLSDDGETNVEAFEALERDFQDVLNQLMGDKNLEKFRIEYEKLHRALTKSYSQEKRLIKKCRELNGEIVNNAAKVTAALKLSQEDQQANSELRKELEKSWQMVDQAQEKELKAKDTINSLKEEITNLSKLVERGAGLSLGQENMLKELVKVRDDLTRENEEKGDRVSLLESQLHNVIKDKEEGEAYIDELKEEISELKRGINKLRGDYEREQRLKDRIDSEFKELSVKYTGKNTELTQVSSQIGVSKEKILYLETQLTETKVTMGKYIRDYELLNARTQRLTTDLEDQTERTQFLMKERNGLEADLKVKTGESLRLQATAESLQKQIDSYKKNIQLLKSKLEESKTPLIVANNEIEALKKEIELSRLAERRIQKELESQEIKTESFRKKTQRAEDKTRAVGDIVEEVKREKHSIATDARALRNEISNLQKTIHSLERERVALQGEVSEVRQEASSKIDDIKLRDIKINELQRLVNEIEGKLKRQQQLYEGVRSEWNSNSKALVEANDTVAELRREAKIAQHMIDQLKDDALAKDQALVKENSSRKEVEKAKENIQVVVCGLRQLLSEKDETVRRQDCEVQRLSALLKRMDDELLQQKKEFDSIVNERELLGTQLIRRNDELALLYEKLKLQSATLTTGEVQYSNRLKDIRVLRLKCMDLQRQIQVLKTSGGKTSDDVKREIFRLQRDLLQEKTKVKALSEELENPLNIHRWRKLEGSDPSTFEMIQKIQTLQKRVINKTEQVVEKEEQITNKEKMIVELKKVLARQPGPEVAEQLSVYQSNLKERNRQLKALAAELNMYQAQSNEYRYEIERLNRELQDVKRKYFDQKRKEALMKEVAKEKHLKEKGAADGAGNIPSMDGAVYDEQIDQARSATTRYVGGGFAIK